MAKGNPFAAKGSVKPASSVPKGTPKGAPKGMPFGKKGC